MAVVDFKKFDANAYRQSTNGILPDGNYLAVIENTEEKFNDRGWKGLSFRFRVVGEEGKGRCVFHLATIEHDNPTAVNIGLGQINDMCRSVGIDPETMKDTAQLQGKPMLIKVGHKFNNFKEMDENVIREFKARNPSIDIAPAPAHMEAAKAATKPAPAVDEDVPF